MKFHLSLSADTRDYSFVIKAGFLVAEIVVQIKRSKIIICGLGSNQLALEIYS